MRETLTDALSAYTGTLLLVTHDRYLMQTLGCPILYLEDGKATFYQTSRSCMTAILPNSRNPPSRRISPRRQAMARSSAAACEVRTRLKALETEIEELAPIC